MIIHSQEDVAFTNPGALSRGTLGYLFGPEATMGFHPPDAIGRHVELHLLPEIQDGEHSGGHRSDGKHDREHTSLKGILHGTSPECSKEDTRLETSLQFACHPSGLKLLCSSHQNGATDPIVPTGLWIIIEIRMNLYD